MSFVIASGGAGGAAPKATASETTAIRVRTLLSSLSAPQKTALKKLLPLDTPCPDVETARYPAALLGILPKSESYSLLGCITEDLLRLPAADITLAAINATVRKWFPDVTAELLLKIAKSKTTDPFLEVVRATQVALSAVVRGTLRFDTVVSSGSVQGHPDAQTDTQLFEVKTTGLMAKNWTDFLLQVFAYGALHEAATDVYLVLPLQRTVWSFSLKGWTKRAEYRTFLETLVKQKTDPTVDKSILPGMMLQAIYGIGIHVPKGRSLATTIASLPAVRPYQLFLSGPMTTRMALKEKDITASAAVVRTSGVHLYIHSQYLINLCAEPGEKDDYAVNCLIKNLQYAVRIGCRGVVVHVGKAVGRKPDVALSNMRTNILKAIEHATPACPLLLETPAGQGTETLTKYSEFVDFVKSFASDRLAICVDTCHVFATGQDPLKYIQDLVATDKALLKLVHFNDSSGCCGSCVDRHAFIGTGLIGLAALTEVARVCSVADIPMVVE